ncbi:RNA polymerase sigma factor [Oceaniferula spumae]|uniref:RNA polymerase sigma factor n=1 Tax=Oceaniferula spumae TaxID=2979115 RepID=A0AAT9FNM9_9BACT
MNIFRHFTSYRLNGPVPPDSASGPTPASGGRNDVTSGGGSEASKQDKNNEISTAEDAAEDVELVRKAQAGDTKAFDRLVSKHRGRIYAMIVNMVKNDADAWDLAQEAFIKAWRALPKFEGKARFSTWLFRISHNVVYDWLRKHKIQGDGELNDEIFDASTIEPSALTTPHHEARPDQAMEREELRKQLEDAIAKLSEEHREVILLREVQGLDYKEIADITNNSIGTVMSRLHYARKKLQISLSTL